MTNRETPDRRPKSEDLTALRARLDAAQTKHQTPAAKGRQEDGRALGQAWRMSTELVVSVMVGLALGYGFDQLVGTTPWGLLVGLGLGFTAGIKTVLVSADKMAKQSSGIPLGDDMPDEIEDE